MKEQVLTKNGFVTISSLKVGDKILDVRGQEQEVLGVYPQGYKAMAKIEFESGKSAKTQVADDVLTNNTISQARYMAEYDPAKHDIHRDTNVPSIVAKVDNGSGMGYIELKYKRMALSYQKKIAEKQSLYLAAKPMALTLYNNKPNQETKDLFTSVKQDWISKNMDVRKYEAVYHQKCTGDSAMLFYFDSNGELQTKVYSYMNGYTIIPHTNSYGEIDFVAFSYMQDTKKMLDCYDNTQMYRFERVEGDEEWKLRLVRSHGFNEVPVAIS